jgi:hypothetical protein
VVLITRIFVRVIDRAVADRKALKKLIAPYPLDIIKHLPLLHVPFLSPLAAWAWAPRSLLSAGATAREAPCVALLAVLPDTFPGPDDVSPRIP